MDAINDPKFFVHYSGLLPEQGPRSWRKVFNFAAAATYDIDLEAETANGTINNVQAMYVDNADNAYATTVTLGDTLQRIVIPPFSQGVFPFFASKVPFFRIATISAEGSLVPVRLLNIPLPFAVWGTQSVGGGSASGINRVSLTPTAGVGTGASVAVLAANAIRKYLHISNHSANSGSVWVNFGATAAAAAASSMEILPGGSLTQDSDGVSVQAVNILATLNETFTVMQG